MTFTYVNMRESATLGFNAVRLSELDKTLCEGSTNRSDRDWDGGTLLHNTDTCREGSLDLANRIESAISCASPQLDRNIDRLTTRWDG